MQNSAKNKTIRNVYSSLYRWETGGKISIYRNNNNGHNTCGTCIELVNSISVFLQHIVVVGHMKMGPWFEVSSQDC